MGRTVKEFKLSVPTAAISAQIAGYLASEGYEYILYEGEKVFKKGMGLAMGPTFIKITPGNGFMRIEAWMKYAAVPGGYLGEYDLDSFVGAAVKGPLKTRFQNIERIIMSFGGVPVAPGYGASVAYAQQPPVQGYAQPANNYPPQSAPVYRQQPSQQSGYRPPYGTQPQAPAAPVVNNVAEASGDTVMLNSFCPVCGSKIRENAKFCEKCGKRVN